MFIQDFESRNLRSFKNLILALRNTKKDFGIGRNQDENYLHWADAKVLSHRIWQP